jgi:hypothetical protein
VVLRGSTARCLADLLAVDRAVGLLPGIVLLAGAEEQVRVALGLGLGRVHMRLGLRISPIAWPSRRYGHGALCSRPRRPFPSPLPTSPDGPVPHPAGRRIGDDSPANALAAEAWPPLTCTLMGQRWMRSLRDVARRRRRGVGMMAAVAMVGVLATGCTPGGPSAESTTTTEPAVTTSPPTTVKPRTTSSLLTDVDKVLHIDPERNYTPDQVAVLKAYVRAEQAMIKANLAPPDPNDPDLAATLTGDQLALVAKNIGEDKAAGTAVTEPELMGIRGGKVEIVSPTVAKAAACLVVQNHRYDIATNQTIGSDEPVAISVESGLKLVDGVWKVSVLAAPKTWPGVMVCLDPLP